MSRILYATEPRQLVHRRTDVFWDIEDASIFQSLDPGSIVRRIKKTLRTEFYNSLMTFHGYVDENVLSEELLNKCCEAGLMIEVAPKAEGVKRLEFLFVYILLIAYNKRGSKYSQNILVLSEDIGQSSKYVQFLEALESEYMNVGFADPHTFVNSGLSGSKQQIVCAECKEFLGYRLEDPDRFQSLDLRNLNLSGSSQAPIISTQAPIVRSGSSQAEKQITFCAHCQFCVNAS